MLNALGKQIFATGASGSGHAMKALNNYVSAAGLIAAVEGVLAAQRFDRRVGRLGQARQNALADIRRHRCLHTARDRPRRMDPLARDPLDHLLPELPQPDAPARHLRLCRSKADDVAGGWGSVEAEHQVR